MLSLTQIKYIVALDQFRHFAQAAQHCHISQPTLSMQVQKAEEQLGLILFDRHPPLKPTSRGKDLIAQMRVVLFEYEKINQLASRSSDEIQGDFSLGVIPTLAPYLIPLFLQIFAEHYPHVHLSIEEMTTSQIEQALIKDQIDGGLLATPLSNSQIVERVLFYEPFQAYVSPRGPLAGKDKLTSSDLKQEGLWILHEGHCLRDQVLNLCDSSWRKEGHQITFQSGNLETLKRLVEKGRGHTVLPLMATWGMNSRQKKCLRSFSQGPVAREISLVHSRIFLKEGILDALERTIIDVLPNELVSLKKNRIKVVSIH